MEEVGKHELEQQTRRQLLIPTLEARQCEQTMLLSNREAEFRRVSGYERERHQTSEGRILIIHPEGNFRSQVLFRPTKMHIFLAYVRQDSKHDAYFSTLLAWRLSPVQHRRAYHNVSEHLVCEGMRHLKRACLDVGDLKTETMKTSIHKVT